MFDWLLGTSEQDVQDRIDVYPGGDITGGKCYWCVEDGADMRELPDASMTVRYRYEDITAWRYTCKEHVETARSELVNEVLEHGQPGGPVRLRKSSIN